MRTLRAAVAVAAAAFALRAAAIPFHACTFFKDRLVHQSMLCANFRVDYGACWLVKCLGPACFTYQGALFTGWMPDHFIEVTNRAGQSAFATPDAPVLIAQLKAASANWLAHGDVQSLSTTQSMGRDGNDQSMFFGRSLPVAYGPVGWRLNTIGMGAGTEIPKCFSAVTENAAETWADNLDSGDRELAALWAPATAPVCGIGGGVVGAISSIPRPSMSIPAALPCAFPLSVPWQKAAALASPTAADPLKQCMGSLGGLYPRTGFTEGGSTYTAAERVAWRTASLAEDYFKTGVGVQSDDKWQIVHPASSGMCFPPGSLLRPSPVTMTETFVRGNPQYDQALVPQHETDYVFAVWRFRSKCVEPGQHFALQGEIATYSTVHSLACRPMNAAMGPP